jgi:Fe-S cluster assembly iron-binding protein IscA
MMPRCSLLLLASLLAAGCDSKPTPVATPATVAPSTPPPPFVEIDAFTAEFLAKLAEAQGFGNDWSVRLEVVWEDIALVKVYLDKKAPGKDDHVVEAQNLRVVMSNEQKVYLKGAKVRFFEVREGAGFDVTFPNRTEQDSEMANEWLKKENKKRANAK